MMLKYSCEVIAGFQKKKTRYYKQTNNDDNDYSRVPGATWESEKHGSSNSFDTLGGGRKGDPQH